MKLEDVKAGMTVRISMGYCRNTEESCGLHKEMLKLRGSSVIVRSVNSDDSISTSNGWTWDAEDLMPISQSVPKTKKKKIKKLFFDEELLWTE